MEDPFCNGGRRGGAGAFAGPANPDPVGLMPGTLSTKPITLGPKEFEGPVEFWKGYGAADGGAGGTLTGCPPLLMGATGLIDNWPEGPGTFVICGGGRTPGTLEKADPGTIRGVTLF